MYNWTVIEICLTVSFPLLVYWFYWRWTHRRMLELANMVPGPPALPLVGNTLIFIANPEQQLDKIEKFMNDYGQYVKFWIGSDLNICVKNPADIRLLLTSNKVNQKGPLYNFVKSFVGEGILTGGSTWRIYRKIATPSYNKKSVQIFGEVFNREAGDLARVLSSKDPNTTFNVYFDVLKCTTQSVCQTLMGLSKEDALDVKRLDEVILKTQGMYGLIFSKMTRWWLQVPLIFYLSGGTALERYFKKIIDEMSSDILAKRRRALETEKANEDGVGIVDRYILDGGLSETEIKRQIFILFTTSQEASAKIASAVLLFLAHMQDWQDKVYNEIIAVLGHEDADVTEDDVKKMQNLDMVYKEVLRYLSIAALIQRTVEDEITINEGKITLPAGTSLVIPIHTLHRDPQYWDEPNKVKPERFLPENVKKRDPNAFVPFSLGAMDCLGRVYATALVKTLVVKVLREVHLEADGALEDLELHVAISVKFAKGYNLRTRPRKPVNGRVNGFA
ncbi:cytochrome P450 4C1-like [Epargyreus clarus]|uniref:cytochrome P450 4C1-like n=1 Tax=Epargyreus clarus TaxID=520877 RepID=UPI003C2B97C9